MGVGSNPTSDKMKIFYNTDMTIGTIQPTDRDSRVAQWKRAGPITQRSVDRNHALLEFFARDNYCSGWLFSSYVRWSVGVVVITSALHAEGRQFDPGTDHSLL